jgi:hypothetical protein
MVTGTFAFSQAELDFIEEEALELYGVDTAAEATDDYKIHTLLKLKALERMWVETADAIDYQADGENFRNSQLSSAIEKMYKMAKKDALVYLPTGYQMTVTPFDEGYSPYRRGAL